MTMEIKYRKNDVVLFDWGGQPRPVRIHKIVNGYVKVRYGWFTPLSFHSRVQTKLGTARMLLGLIYWGFK